MGKPEYAVFNFIAFYISRNCWLCEEGSLLLLLKLYNGANSTR